MSNTTFYICESIGGMIVGLLLLMRGMYLLKNQKKRLGLIYLALGALIDLTFTVKLVMWLI